MFKVLPYAISLFLLIASMYASYQWGYTTRDKEIAYDQYNASMEAMSRIQKTFDEYENLVSQIETANDHSPVPPLIKSTIDSLPIPSNKK